MQERFDSNLSRSPNPPVRRQFRAKALQEYSRKVMAEMAPNGQAPVAYDQEGGDQFRQS
jgi:hypothetical protein